MTTTIITKNSSTASAVPTSSDLVQGELAVNVTDKRLFTENGSATIVELGTNPSSITTTNITASGTVTASTAFSGNLTGNVTGNVTGDVTGDLTGDVTGNVTAASGTTTLNNLSVGGSVTGTLNTADLVVTGNITVSGTVDGRDVATDGTKLDTIETNADVTDSTNVDAAGAVMNTDTTTASMSFVIDEDNMVSDLDTKVPTQQSVKKYVDDTVIAIGGVTVSPTPTAGQYARWTSGSELEGVDLSIDPTKGTLTKTFVTNEQSTITLSSAPSGQPVVSVTKEVPQVGVTNNSWNVGALNYTLPTESPATTLDFSYSGSGSHLSDPSKSYAPPSVTGQVRGIRFNNDGTKMFLLDDNDDQVWEYTLSTAYDVSTATEVDSISASSQESTARGFCFNDDGTKLFVIGQGSDTVFEYTLSTGFDVSTGSYSGNSYSVNSQDALPQDVSFSSDGLKMFVLGGSGSDINEYTLSSAFDITSTVTFIDSFRVDSAGDVAGMSFSSDGLFVYVTYDNAYVIGRYALSTAWDISTADYIGGINIASLNSTYADQVYGVCITDSDTKMVFGTNDGSIETVVQYDVIGPVLTKGTGSWSLDDLGATITANSGTFKLLDIYGATEELTAPTGTTQVSSGNWDIEYIEYNSTDGDLQYITDSSGVVDLTNLTTTGSTLYFRNKETSGESIFMKPDGTKFYLIGTSGDDVNEYSLSTPYDLTTATFTTSFSVSAQETNPAGLCFSQDGSWMFVTGNSGDDINRYALSTAWDVSTASVSGTVLSVSAQQTNPDAVAVNDDGSQIWVCGNNGIHEYSMSSYVIGSASFVQTAALGTVTWFDWNADGTELYVLTSDYILSRYTPSTAWDISTIGSAVTSTYVAGSDTITSQKCALGNYGEYIYIMGVNWVDCQTTTRTPSQPVVAITTNSIDSTYWTDINSMTATESGSGTIYYAISTDDRTTWSVVDDTNGERDIVRNNAGTWEYNSNATYGSETWTAGATNTELATLEEAIGTAQNQMDKTQLDAVTDANHITLGNDLDLAIIFNGHSDAVAGASSDGVSINYDANTLNEGAVLGTDYDFDYPASDKVRITSLAANNLKVRVV